MLQCSAIFDYYGNIARGAPFSRVMCREAASYTILSGVSWPALSFSRIWNHFCSTSLIRIDGEIRRTAGVNEADGTARAALEEAEPK